MCARRWLQALSVHLCGGPPSQDHSHLEGSCPAQDRTLSLESAAGSIQSADCSGSNKQGCSCTLEVASQRGIVVAGDAEQAAAKVVTAGRHLDRRQAAAVGQVHLQVKRSHCNTSDAWTRCHVCMHDAASARLCAATSDAILRMLTLLRPCKGISKYVDRAPGLDLACRSISN